MTQGIFILIVFLPLLGFLLVGLASLLGKSLSESKSWFITTGLLCVSALLAWWVFFASINASALKLATADEVAITAGMIDGTTAGDVGDVAAINAGNQVVAIDAATHAQSGVSSHAKVYPLLQWIGMAGLDFSWSLQFDGLTLVMLLVVTSVSALVHIYSRGYMHGDKSFARFMAYLSLFTFSMLMLVSSDNLVQMFFGWEGVGLASYLLIGFWYERDTARAAAIKAFLVNRVGDIGFALGIFALYQLTGSVKFVDIFAALPSKAGASFNILGFELPAITSICLLLFLGAMGKSAQLGLHTWLPDAMEGPTPVSALIHAATMVTAGVFMVCRLSPLFEMSDVALQVIIWVGALTAFMAGSIGLTQYDIKRVIAYSTCSQLGFMFLAAGYSAYGIAMFHLTTHAFFKALLFLGAGSVIHAMSGEQDLRRMGGIAKYLPYTRRLMWIGSLSLAGFPLFSGYWSKDLILEVAYAGGETAGVGLTESAFLPFWLLVVATFFTSFYSFRLLFLCFYGKTRAEKKVIDHAHESPAIMIIPLLLLGFGAIFAGVLLKSYFVGDASENFWQGVLALDASHRKILEAIHDVPLWVKWSPTAMFVLGFLVAFIFYMVWRKLPQILAKILMPFYQFSYHKWFFDELYHYLLVIPTRYLARFLWQKGDVGTIDNLGPNFIRLTSLSFSRLVRAGQTGLLYHYLLVLVLGLMAFLAFYLLAGYK